MRRILVSSEEAVPAKGQHQKPCSDCPWARTALNGWLGDNTAKEWVAFAHGEAHVECHSLTGVQCAGIAIYRANNGKLPRDPHQLRLPPDTTLVFESPMEFLDHHAKAPTMPKPSTATTFEAIQGLINEVERDTANITRQQYREFLEEVQGEAEIRLEALEEDERRKPQLSRRTTDAKAPERVAPAKASPLATSGKHRRR
jgi:hypothetical protein